MYKLDDYYDDIKNKGLEETWDFILDNNIPLSSSDFSITKLGERYEDGLARTNKIEKKEMGKYYTPQDVAIVMAKEFLSLPGENICDVCCGVGNLIIAVLDQLNKDQAIDLIKNKKIYLYDIDPVAVKICKYTLGAIYGFEYISNIQCIVADILNSEIKLPNNCKVISNPPYGKISTINSAWDEQTIIKESKDYYAAIMAKVINGSISTCIITPHSYMYSDKFHSLRKLMCKYGGKIFAFDNVPGNIFNGVKFGIFNTNNVNSVRAAITIIDHSKNGYRVSPFIRFLSNQRSVILQNDYLNSLLSNDLQKDDTCFYRIFSNTENIVNKWLTYPPLKNFITTKPNQYKITIPNTCRYYLSGTLKELNRSGKIVIYAKDETSFYYLYIMLNSSFGYYWHRICNGGITYTLNLLHSLPVITGDLDTIISFVKELMDHEEDYLTTARNAGSEQENIKFTEEQREKLNQYLCEILQVPYNKSIFTLIHNNTIIDNF